MGVCPRNRVEHIQLWAFLNWTASYLCKDWIKTLNFSNSLMLLWSLNTAKWWKVAGLGRVQNKHHYHAQSDTISTESKNIAISRVFVTHGQPTAQPNTDHRLIHIFHALKNEIFTSQNRSNNSWKHAANVDDEVECREEGSPPFYLQHKHVTCWQS